MTVNGGSLGNVCVVSIHTPTQGVTETEKSLGYIHLNVKPVLTNEITIRLKGASKEGDGFGQIVEVAAPAAGELDLFKAKNGDKTNHELRIVEIEFKENLWQ